jgi:hypothetical protein
MRLNLSGSLSIIISLFKSLSNLINSFTNEIPLIEVCCVYNQYLIYSLLGCNLSKVPQHNLVFEVKIEILKISLSFS